MGIEGRKPGQVLGMGIEGRKPMRRYVQGFALILGGTMLAFGTLMALTGEGSLPGDRRQEKALKVLTFLPAQNKAIGLDEFYLGLMQGLEKGGGGADLSVYSWRESESLSREEYETMVAEALKPDFLILSAGDTALLESGIPYFLYDGDPEQEGYLAYVGNHNLHMGARAAGEALELLPDGEIRAAVLYPSENTVFLQRRLGFEETAAREERLTVAETFCSHWDSQSCRAYLSSLLAKGEVNLLFCEDSVLASIAAEFMEALPEKERLCVIGIDMTETAREHLEEGGISLILDQDFFQTGVTLMDLILRREEQDFPLVIYQEEKVLRREGDKSEGADAAPGSARERGEEER